MSIQTAHLDNPHPSSFSFSETRNPNHPFKHFFHHLDNLKSEVLLLFLPLPSLSLTLYLL